MMERYNGTNETIFYSVVELDRGTYVFSVYVYENGEMVNGSGLFSSSVRRTWRSRTS